MPIHLSVAEATVLVDVMGTLRRDQQGQHAALTLVPSVGPSRRTAPTPSNREAARNTLERAPRHRTGAWRT
jgi:hypothetical protein